MTPPTDVLSPKRKNKPAKSSDSSLSNSSPVVDTPILPSDRQRRWSRGINWPVAVWIAGVHIAALFAPLYFTWVGLATFLVLQWVTGSLGVCLGYHRLLTHGSFVTSKPMRWFLAFLGGLSGEGSALSWVTNHRKHHVHSDQEEDPHSPLHGTIWSHMLWFLPTQTNEEFEALVARWAPDLGRDPVIRLLHKLFLPIHFVSGLVLYAIGASIWDSYTGWSLVFWGLFVRMVYMFHVTWLVNSATHLWGYRNYTTTDNSRNLWWVGLLAFGEGWHNNHHAHQRMARHGHRWWEVDVTYWVILGLERLGLVWKVVHDVPGREYDVK